MAKKLGTGNKQADASDSHQGQSVSLSPTSKCHSGKTHKDELSHAKGRKQCEVENLELDDGCDLITG